MLTGETPRVTSLEPVALFSGLDLARRVSVVAAVSGGGDSLALLFLLKAFLDVHAPHTRLLAVTVDHRLRAEAAEEARTVARLCDRHGIAHRTIAWTREKPPTGVIAAARDARHRLLAEAAIEAGTDLVLTGHTLNDQAETLAMRRARQDGGEGLSGIAPATLHSGAVWFCRPLLGVKRAGLRDWLARRGIAWIDDPSNDNPAYERVRVRANLDDREVDALAVRAAEAGRQRIALASGAARLIGEFASHPAVGLFRIDSRMFEPFADSLAAPVVALVQSGKNEAEVQSSTCFPHAAIVLALRAILASAGGVARPPDRGRVGTLAGRLARGPLRATLSRAIVDARPSGIWIRREARNLPIAELSAVPVIWDGRWRLSVADGRRGIVAGPIGRCGRSVDAEPVAGVPQSLVRAALSTEPGLFNGGHLVPHAADAAARALGVVAAPLVAPHALYLPSFDLELAAALLKLLGLPPLPAAPWNHHIDAGA